MSTVNHFDIFYFSNPEREFREMKRSHIPPPKTRLLFPQYSCSFCIIITHNYYYENDKFHFQTRITR